MTSSEEAAPDDDSSERPPVLRQRSIRVEDELWLSAMAKAARRRRAGHHFETVSQVVRQHLIAYTKRGDDE